MAILNDNQSKELCKKIEQCILKNGYFIFDTDDWSGLHIEYKPFTHGKNYEYADYTEITVTFDGYNVTDKLQVKYNFIKSVYVGRTGDSYRVYYKRENGEKDGGRPYSMNEAAEFIANRFIGLVEDKIMNKKLEARITKLERLLKESDYTYLDDSADAAADDLIFIEDTIDRLSYNELREMHMKSKNIGNERLSAALYKLAQCWIMCKREISNIENNV